MEVFIYSTCSDVHIFWAKQNKSLRNFAQIFIINFIKENPGSTQSENLKIYLIMLVVGLNKFSDKNSLFWYVLSVLYVCYHIIWTDYIYILWYEIVYKMLILKNSDTFHNLGLHQLLMINLSNCKDKSLKLFIASCL